jgi:hypothetical protein
MAYLTLACTCLIGVVFAVSAVAKLRGRRTFRTFADWLGGLPLPLARSRPGPVAAAIAAAEVTIVVLAALPWTAPVALMLAVVVLAVFTAGTGLAVARGADAPCQCFGPSTTRLAPRHVVRNALLCAAAAAGAVATGGGGTEPAGVVLSLAAGLAVALFVVFLDDLAALFSATA